MKKLVTAFVLAALVAGAAMAQSSNHPKGTMGLQFSVYGLSWFGMGTVPVGTLVTTTTNKALEGIGGEYYLSNALSVGGSVGLSISSNKPTGGTTSTLTIIGVRPSIRYVLIASGPIELGTGAYLDLASYSTGGFSSSVFGVGGLLDARYFIIPKVALGASYSLAMDFQNGDFGSASLIEIGTLGTTLTFFF